jgi:hypothetical protein
LRLSKVGDDADDGGDAGEGGQCLVAPQTFDVGGAEEDEQR